MFAQRENNTGKKKFQKPNILRRKPKGPVKSSVADNECFRASSLVPATCVSTSPPFPLTKQKCSTSLAKPVQRLKLDSNILDQNSTHGSTDVDIRSNDVGNDLLLNNNEENMSQSSVNVELFLNNDTDSTQNIAQFDIDCEIDRIKHDWCLDFGDGSQEIIIEDFDGSELGTAYMRHDSPLTCMVTLPPMSSGNDQDSNEDLVYTATPVPNLTIEYLASSTMNFKCDAPECNRRFRSEHKLNEHKIIHNIESVKAARQTTIECPVKKVGGSGLEEPCGRTFSIRDELVKHLNEDHTPQDAAYVCGECGRRFFWASGVRAHARSHAGRPAAQACPWPGCGRVFRLPCRLREHARAHTGDKPYPCRFPGCNWSFRTASKLLRHARRHTGERRHACAACPRAFLRREHLRDHLARHHAAKHACPHSGCQRNFTNVSALYTHIKKVHREEPADTVETLTSASNVKGEETYMVHLEPPVLDTETLPEEVETAEVETDAIENVVAEADVEWHAARTHCTWPLRPRATSKPELQPEPEPEIVPESNPEVEPGPEPEPDLQPVPEPELGAEPDPEPVYAETINGRYIVEEDVQIELSEGSESNIYTIRSDLFLHGNVLTNEDSEHITGADVSVVADAEAAEMSVAPHAIDADLSLLDAHPSIDLMQEELMYTDAAVDESSFRVFLLSGEEIQII